MSSRRFAGAVSIAIGFGLLYLAALNTALALASGTCTGGNADSLFGGIYSLLLNSFGLTLLYFGKPKLSFFAIVIPLLPIFWWQLSFTFRLTSGYLVYGMSACEAKTGLEYNLDGHEVFFVWLWVIVDIALFLGLTLAFWRSSGSRFMRQVRP
jgi:hypothetical protein